MSLKEVIIGGQTWFQYGEDDEFLKNIEQFKEHKKEEFLRKKSSPTRASTKEEKKQQEWKQVKMNKRRR